MQICRKNGRTSSLCLCRQLKRSFSSGDRAESLGFGVHADSFYMRKIKRMSEVVFALPFRNNQPAGIRPSRGNVRLMKIRVTSWNKYDMWYLAMQAGGKRAFALLRGGKRTLEARRNVDGWDTRPVILFEQIFLCLQPDVRWVSDENGEDVAFRENQSSGLWIVWIESCWIGLMFIEIEDRCLQTRAHVYFFTHEALISYTF